MGSIKPPKKPNNMRIFNRPLSCNTLTLLVAAYFVLALNLPFYAALREIFAGMDTVDTGFIISIPFALFFILTFVFSLFSWPYIGKPFFAILILVSSVVNYAGYNYKIIFDQDMLVNFMQTNQAEAIAYFSTYSVLWVCLSGVLPALFLFTRTIRPEKHWWLILLKKLGVMAISLLVIVAIAGVYYKDYASIGRNHRFLEKTIIPSYYLKSTYKLIKQEYFTQPIEYKQSGMDARQVKSADKKPTLLVFVVGETARTQNQQYAGYHRQTNEFTQKYHPLFFSNVSSCGTATATSVPCMFSSLTRNNFDRKRADNQDNVLDILQRAGIKVSWVDNSDGDKHVAKNIADTVRTDRELDPKNCNGKTCFDEILLSEMDARLNKDAQTPENQDYVLFLHLIGSHGPTYFQRYPQSMAVFQPECAQADIENCSNEAVINTYDNTLRYSDYVIAKIIEKLTTLTGTFDVGLIYVSDHGESLGENGVFLHGLPYAIAPDTQTTVPLLIWLSPELAEEKSIDLDCLAAHSKNPYSHDNLFSSLLGFMDVQTAIYQKEEDIFAGCRQ